MPYARTLQAYTRPEFFTEAPEAWERCLREVSPVTPNLSHLRFRLFEARPDWATSEFNTRPDRPIWAIYTATPRPLVHPDKAEQLRLHWSELASDQQVGRRAMVSDYQHFMWHTQGVLVQPFWLLMGEWGGTPTMYTEREKAYLRGSGLSTIPAPIGFFAGCPFDERVVTNVLARDRLLQSGNRFDELEKQDRPDHMKAEDEAAERLYRETYLETLAVWHAPAVEFMQSQLGKAQVNEALPPAPEGLVNTLAQWKDVWRETGRVMGVTAPTSKQVNVPITVTHHIN